MEVIKEALMQWGEAYHQSMENCTFFIPRSLIIGVAKSGQVRAREVLSMMTTIL